MPAANYPNGFMNGVIIQGVPIQMTNPGKVFWVNNSTVLADGAANGSNTNSGDYRHPFQTIDYAIGRCLASRGDVIMAMPGHSETITTDGGIALDVAGVAVIGLGRGTIRPKIVLDTAAAAAVAVSAANVLLHNIVLEASFADITNAIDVTAVSFHADKLHFQEEGANLNFIDYISATGGDNTADNLTITGCTGFGIDAAINSPLQITGDLEGLVMTDCRWNTDHANALAMVQQATGKDLPNMYVARNLYASLKASGDILIDNDTTVSNGWCVDNYAFHADTASEVLADATGVLVANNKASAVVDLLGFEAGTADA